MTLAKVLLVDDSSLALVNIKELLEKEGFSVELIDESSPISYIASKFAPDLIILKYGSRKLDSCKNLHECPATKHIPIVLIAGSGAIEETMQALKYGCIDFVTTLKPGDILSKVNTYYKLAKVMSTTRTLNKRAY